MIVLKDANGKYVPIEQEELMKAIQNGTLYGMPMNCVFEFRDLYIEFGGEEPITIASIKRLFDRFRPKMEDKTCQ